MRRYGVAFAPLMRGYSESISRVGGAVGILQKRPKITKEKLNYEKSKYDISGDAVGAGLLCVFARNASGADKTASGSEKTASDSRKGAIASTNSRHCVIRVQHGGRRPCSL